MTQTFTPQQLDFLYWHAVSKTRISMFVDAAVLFRLIAAADPKRTDALLGRVYCMIREGELQDANDLLGQLDMKSLAAHEADLAIRLKRRCQFELTAGQQPKAA
jgi:thioredoxin-like negative regulator of GroEL